MVISRLLLLGIVKLGQQSEVRMRVGLNWLKRELHDAVKRPAGFVVGLVFTVAAIAAIQYDETIAPKLSGLADSFSGATGDVVRRFS